MTKIKLIVVGSLINVAVKVEETFNNNKDIRVDLDILHIASSHLDIHQGVETINIGGNGAGGNRARSMEMFKENKTEIGNHVKDEDTLYIILGGMNGGTSTVIPMLLPMIGDKPLQLALTENSSKGKNMENSLKSYQSVAMYAQKKRGLNLFVSRDKSIDESDDELLKLFTSIGLLLSPLEKMDQNDVLNTFKPILQNKLYGFNVYFDNVVSERTVLSREIVLDGNYDGLCEPIEGEYTKQGHVQYELNMHEGTHKLVYAVRRNVYDEHIAHLTKQVGIDKEAIIEVTEIVLPDFGDDDDMIFI